MAIAILSISKEYNSHTSSTATKSTIIQTTQEVFMSSRYSSLAMSSWALAYSLINGTHTRADSSALGVVLGITFGILIGVPILIFAGSLISKCLISKCHARKIKQALKKAEKKERADLERARREYERSETGRLGPNVGKVVDVEITDLSYPPPTYGSHNENHDRKTLSRRESNFFMGIDGNAPSKPRNNWLWWRRMQMTSRDDLEQGTHPINPKGELHTDKGRLHLHRTNAQRDVPMQDLRRPGPMPIQTSRSTSMSASTSGQTQSQIQSQKEKEKPSHVENNKDPNILDWF